MLPAEKDPSKWKDRLFPPPLFQFRWTFLISTLFFCFFFWNGAGEAKYSEGTGSSLCKTKLPCCHNLCTQMLSLTKALMLWEKSGPSLPWQEPREMLGEQAPGELRAGGASPRGSQFLLPPPFPLQMFLLHVGEGRDLWFHSEIICFRRRKKELRSNQEEWLKKFIRDGWSN